MKIRLLGCGVLVLFALGLVACGDDDDGDGGGGGGACANAEMVCASDPDVTIDCADFSGAPASVQTCVSNATSCDAVLNCVLMASPVTAGSGG